MVMCCYFSASLCFLYLSIDQSEFFSLFWLVVVKQKNVNLTRCKRKNRIAIYVTSDRKRAFYDPLTERRKFSRPRKIFAERDSERNAFTLPFLSRDLQIFFESWKFSTSGSGSLNAAFSITSDIQHFIFQLKFSSTLLQKIRLFLVYF